MTLPIVLNNRDLRAQIGGMLVRELVGKPFCEVHAVALIIQHLRQYMYEGAIEGFDRTGIHAWINQNGVVDFTFEVYWPRW